MASTEIRPDDVPFPALLRAAWQAYAKAVHIAMVEAGFDDIPKSGTYVIGAVSRANVPLSRIIEALAVSKQTAGQLVDALVLRGYLQRAVDENDRRRLIITLTERGEAAAAVSREAVERLDAALLKNTGREHIKDTRATLIALIRYAGGDLK